MEPVLRCPHCHEFFIMEKLNCGIFRHGIYKSNFKQIDPHLPKLDCIQLIENQQIIGCGKPFRINNTNNKFEVEICDYI